jgi:hypothetical protein
MKEQVYHPTQPARKERPFLPRMNDGGILARFGELRERVLSVRRGWKVFSFRGSRSGVIQVIEHSSSRRPRMALFFVLFALLVSVLAISCLNGSLFGQTPFLLASSVGMVPLVCLWLLTRWWPVGSTNKGKADQGEKAPQALEEMVPGLVQRYRQALLNDGSLTKIQNVGMSVPVPVRDMYIRPRVRFKDVYRVQHVQRWQQRLQAYLRLGTQTTQNQSQFREGDPLNLLEQAEYRSCVILGDPGVGKTTFLKYLVLRALGEVATEETERRLGVVPIFLHLRECVSEMGEEEPPDLLQCIGRDLLELRGLAPGERAFSSSTSLVWRRVPEIILEQGYPVLLLLDGLDETFRVAADPKKSYKLVVDAINILAGVKKYTNLRIVVSVRKSTYFQLGEFLRLSDKQRFPEVELLPFRSDDIRHFVSNWWRTEPPAGFDPTDFLTKLDQSPPLRALAGNPLLLQLMISASSKYNFLEDRDRALLSDRCLGCFAVWDESRGIKRAYQLTREDYQILGRVAYHFAKKCQGSFPAEEVLACLKQQEVGDAEDFLRRIAGTSGLLTNTGDGRYRFLFGEFQEHFAAGYLAMQ